MATTSDTALGLRGRLWLQGTPEGDAIPGRLFLETGSDPLLELDEALTLVIRSSSRSHLPSMARSRTGELVTMPSAFTAEWTERATGCQSNRLQPFYALLGDHVNGADALFTRARARVRHFDAWASLEGFTGATSPRTVTGHRQRK